MKRTLLLIGGGLLTVFGLLFLLQGSNILKGSAMSDNHFWIYAGAVIAIVGLAVLTLGIRTARTIRAR